MSEPIIIHEQPSNVGDVIEHDGLTLIVDKHFAQGKDMKGLDYSHIMFNQKGAFGLRVATDNHSQ